VVHRLCAWGGAEWRRNAATPRALAVCPSHRPAARSRQGSVTALMTAVVGSLAPLRPRPPHSRSSPFPLAPPQSVRPPRRPCLRRWPVHRAGLECRSLKAPTVVRRLLELPSDDEKQRGLRPCARLTAGCPPPQLESSRVAARDAVDGVHATLPLPGKLTCLRFVGWRRRAASKLPGRSPTSALSALVSPPSVATASAGRVTCSKVDAHLASSPQRLHDQHALCGEPGWWQHSHATAHR
jgi:hypothetical protein